MGGAGRFPRIKIYVKVRLKDPSTLKLYIKTPPELNRALSVCPVKGVLKSLKEGSVWMSKSLETTFEEDIFITPAHLGLCGIP